MQAGDAETRHEQEFRYYASYYVSKRYGEIIFAIMQVEFTNQLIEREPVLVLDLETPPKVVGFALKAILAESNVEEAINNPLLRHTLLESVQGKIFYTQNDYAENLLLIPDKQTHVGNAYIKTPAYQSSKARTKKDFGKYYLHFRIDATDDTIFMRTVFNEWDAVHLSKQVALNTDNEVLGEILLGFSKACQ